jgi:hypothetical protein
MSLLYASPFPGSTKYHSHPSCANSTTNEFVLDKEVIERKLSKCQLCRPRDPIHFESEAEIQLKKEKEDAVRNSRREVASELTSLCDTMKVLSSSSLLPPLAKYFRSRFRECNTREDFIQLAQEVEQVAVLFSIGTLSSSQICSLLDASTAEQIQALTGNDDAL